MILKYTYVEHINVITYGENTLILSGIGPLSSAPFRRVKGTTVYTGN